MIYALDWKKGNRTIVDRRKAGAIIVLRCSPNLGSHKELFYQRILAREIAMDRQRHLEK